MKSYRMVALALLFGASQIGAQQPGATVAQPNRTALEQRLRERMAQVIQKRLNLSDPQMTQLQAVNARYAPQISKLATQERETRRSLRAQVMSAAPDQTQVGQLLDTVLKLQKDRVTLLETEQHELAAFLTPVQRAQYMGLQAEMKRRTEQLRRRAMMGPGGGPRGRAGIRQLR